MPRNYKPGSQKTNKWIQYRQIVVRSIWHIFEKGNGEKFHSYLPASVWFYGFCLQAEVWRQSKTLQAAQLDLCWLETRTLLFWNVAWTHLQQQPDGTINAGLRRVAAWRAWEARNTCRIHVLECGRRAVTEKLFQGQGGFFGGWEGCVCVWGGSEWGDLTCYYFLLLIIPAPPRLNKHWSFSSSTLFNCTQGLNRNWSQIICTAAEQACL